MKVSRRDWALSPAQKYDAREAFALLDGTGITLAEAARMAINGRRAARRITFLDAVSEFQRELLLRDPGQPGGRQSTQDWYATKLSRPQRELGDKMFDEIARSDLKAFFAARTDWSEGTKAATVRALRALWRWGMSCDEPIAVSDPTLGLSGRSSSNRGDAEFLTVDQVKEVMNGAGRHRNALALLFFSGIRPEEVAGRDKERLRWRQIDVVGKTIRIPDNISKTGKPRVNEGFPATLWAWLQPSKPDDPISVGTIRQATDHAKTILGLKRWPHDSTRHTFATYALAFSGDPGKVAHWIGHEGKTNLLHQTYRGLTTKTEAEKFFGINPTT